jgi:hypothetical protein
MTQEERIDFISAYCDRWCARCAFTSRCSLFAIEMAEGMCGDLGDAIELAVGAPHPESNEDAPRPSAAWIAEMNSSDISDRESEAVARDLDARRTKATESPIGNLAWAWSIVALRWLEARAEQASSGADPLLKEAFEVAIWDPGFIAGKLMRAVEGRLEFQAGGSVEDDPIQNDWNGTAKVALISIERSEHAWRTIAQATGDETPASLADQLADLRLQVEAEFPKAWQFVRPGFDEPGR